MEQGYHKHYKVRVVSLRGEDLLVCSETSQGGWKAWIAPQEGVAAQTFTARTREEAERQAIEEYERGERQ